MRARVYDIYIKILFLKIRKIRRKISANAINAFLLDFIIILIYTEEYIVNISLRVIRIGTNKVTHYFKILLCYAFVIDDKIIQIEFGGSE